MADDRHAAHAQEGRAPVLRVVEELEESLDFGPADRIGEGILQQLGEHAPGGLVELENRVAHEPVAHHDVDAPGLAGAREDVATFHVAEVVDVRRRLEQLVGFLNDRVPLLVFLADVERPNTGPGAAQHVPGVHRAKVREVHELAGVAVHVGTAVDHDHRMSRRREQRADGRALHPVVQAQHQGGCRHDRAGVAGGDEGVGGALLLQG